MFRAAFALGLLCGLPVAHAAAPALMPLPVTVQAGTGKLPIDISFTAAATGISDPRLDAALQRFLATLARQTGILIGFTQPADAAHAKLRVECTAAGPAYPTLGEDESYKLDVTAEGAHLMAPTIDGALRGLATFAQLVVPDADGFRVPPVHIEDRPRFPWRGLMIDASRHWMPVSVIERNLDAMAAVKLNVFHWHLSDDQGFRVESKLFPKLQQLGSDGNYYTQAELRHIVAYAAARGIRVIPEFDIPGHTQSWFPGYPQLTSTDGPFTILRTWGINDPVMDPTRDSTYEFLDAFIGEMVGIFPDPYFHIGGDEVNGNQWKSTSAVAAFAQKNNLTIPQGLQTYFNQRVLKIVEKYNRIMVGWDEILTPDLPAAAVIHSWRGNKALADAVGQGHRGILSWGYYLDHLSPASLHYANDPLGGPAASLPADQAARILGGEACMWAEYVNMETVDSRIWPRMAAIAERLWSPKEVTDVASMYERMYAVSRQLDWTGIQHRAGYRPMLDRLAAGRPAAALYVLADASQALGLGPRARAKKYTDLTPLNRFVDAVRPESETVMVLDVAANRVVKKQPLEGDLAVLRDAFQQWADNDARFQRLAEDNVLLSELKPLSKDLSALGAMGLRALAAVNGGQAVTASWVTSQTAEITRMAKPNAEGAEVNLAAVRTVKILVDSLK